MPCLANHSADPPPLPKAVEYAPPWKTKSAGLGFELFPWGKTAVIEGCSRPGQRGTSTGDVGTAGVATASFGEMPDAPGPGRSRIFSRKPRDPARMSALLAVTCP